LKNSKTVSDICYELITTSRLMQRLEETTMDGRESWVTLDMETRTIIHHATVVKYGQLQNAAKAESCPLRENATGRF